MHRPAWGKLNPASTQITFERTHDTTQALRSSAPIFADNSHRPAHHDHYQAEEAHTRVILDDRRSLRANKHDVAEPIEVTSDIYFPQAL